MTSNQQNTARATITHLLRRISLSIPDLATGKTLEELRCKLLLEECAVLSTTCTEPSFLVRIETTLETFDTLSPLHKSELLRSLVSELEAIIHQAEACDVAPTLSTSGLDLGPDPADAPLHVPLSDDNELLSEFAKETTRLLIELEDELQGGPANGTEDIMERAFRYFHTVKGGAIYLGLNPVSDLARELEFLLDSVKSHTLSFSDELLALTLKGSGTLRDFAREIAARVDRSTPNTPFTIPTFRLIATIRPMHGKSAPEPTTTEPALEPPPPATGAEDVNSDNPLDFMHRKGNPPLRGSAAEAVHDAKILVVDDSKMMRIGIIRSLRQLGFQTMTEAENGREALDLLKKTNYDLMLLDVEMPEVNGLQVLDELRRNPQSAPPVIVISGSQHTGDAVRCIEMGAEDYLPKPFDPVLLRARVATSIERKRLRDLEKEHLSRIREEHDMVLAEKEKTDKLLHNILPRSIVHRLKGGEKLIADAHPSVTVLFADLVGFTQLSRNMEASRLVKMLNAIFSAFDMLVERSGLEKIKTIGDSYMVVSGAPEHRERHAQAAAELALSMVENVVKINDVNQTDLQVRIGLNSGPVVAGVIGMRKFTYDLWGDTVNTASRIETAGVPGKVHCSAVTAELLKEEFDLEDNGPMELKGIGTSHTFFIKGRKPMEWTF
jgi:adenylate cyclase